MENQHANQKLLLADDSVTIQKVVNLTFADEGIDVTSVGDGNSAIELIIADKPDIILADVNMPGLNGYEICSRVKSHPELSKTPVVLLVGSFEPFDEEEAERVNADGYLTKPFQSISQLVEKVHHLLGSEVESEFEETAPETDEARDVLPTPNMSFPDPFANRFESTEPEGVELLDEELDTLDLSSPEPSEMPTFTRHFDDDDQIEEFDADSLTTQPLDESDLRNIDQYEDGVTAGDDDQQIDEFVPVANEETSFDAAQKETETPLIETEHEVPSEAGFELVDHDVEQASSHEVEEVQEIPAENRFEPVLEEEFEYRGSGIDSSEEADPDIFKTAEPEIEEEDEVLLETEVPIPEAMSALFLDEMNLLKLPPIEKVTGGTSLNDEDNAEVARLLESFEDEDTAFSSPDDDIYVEQPNFEIERSSDEMKEILSNDLVEKITHRVIEALSEKAIKDIAWEVVPDMAEIIIRKMAEEELEK